MTDATANEYFAALHAECDRLLARCAYLELRLGEMRAERDEARADAMAAILDHGLNGPAGRT